MTSFMKFPRLVELISRENSRRAVALSRQQPILCNKQQCRHSSRSRSKLLHEAQFRPRVESSQNKHYLSIFGSRCLHVSAKQCSKSDDTKNLGNNPKLHGHIAKNDKESRKDMGMKIDMHVPRTFIKDSLTTQEIKNGELSKGKPKALKQAQIPTEKTEKKKLKLPDPGIDWDFILKDENLEKIKENIQSRKGMGDIDKVRTLWNKLNYPEEVEMDDGKDLTKIKKQMVAEAIGLPNQTHPDAPIGDESQNKLVETVGEMKEFSFDPRTIVQLGEELGMLRTENLGYTTGPKTYYLMDGLAQLEQALIRYTLDTLEEAEFSLISVPDLIHPDVVERCGFKTSGERTQVYKLDPLKHGDLALAGTGEMPIAGLLMGQNFRLEDLPQKLVTVSRCFRAETSDADEEKGIYRVHQFTKVEMFGVTAQDSGTESEGLLKEFIEIQKKLFTQLGLHFRVLEMASHELGAPAYRKYDMEAWMPAKQFWGEISSASNCTDFQGRRLGIKYESGDSLKHVHTINGTACAVPRMIMAIVENNQNQDGTIEVPTALQKYLDGVKVFKKTSTPFQTKMIKLTKNYKAKTNK